MRTSSLPPAWGVTITISLGAIDSPVTFWIVVPCETSTTLPPPRRFSPASARISRTSRRISDSPRPKVFDTAAVSSTRSNTRRAVSLQRHIGLE